MESSAVIDLESQRRACTQCWLRTLCLPAGASTDDMERLERLVKKRRTIGRGEYLYRAGSGSARLYVARDGAFKTVAGDADGSQQVVGFHLPGELVGLDALGDDAHRCDAIALDAARVCEVPLADLAEATGAVAGLQRQLLRVIGYALNRGHDHLEMMGRRQADERILLFLLDLSRRFEALGRDGEEFVLPMTREDIASYLGLVIETVSRSFTRLQDDGVIAVRGRRLRLLAPRRDEETREAATRRH